jgi:hypothetical protein
MEISVADVSAAEDGLGCLCMLEMGASEIGTCKVRPLQMGRREFRLLGVASAKLRLLKLARAAFAFLKMNTCQLRGLEMARLEIGLVEVSTREVRSECMNASQISASRKQPGGVAGVHRAPPQLCIDQVLASKGVPDEGGLFVRELLAVPMVCVQPLLVQCEVPFQGLVIKLQHG